MSYTIPKCSEGKQREDKLLDPRTMRMGYSPSAILSKVFDDNVNCRYNMAKACAKWDMHSVFVTDVWC